MKFKWNNACEINSKGVRYAKFLKWLGIIILVMNLFVALTYGGMEIYGLMRDVTLAAADENADMFTAALPHFKGIALVGADLALLVTGFRDGRDLLRDADIDRNSRNDEYYQSRPGLVKVNEKL